MGSRQEVRKVEVSRKASKPRTGKCRHRPTDRHTERQGYGMTGSKHQVDDVTTCNNPGYVWVDHHYNQHHHQTQMYTYRTGTKSIHITHNQLRQPRVQYGMNVSGGNIIVTFIDLMY